MIRIGIISTASYSLPLLQYLVNNRLQVSVFTDACSYDAKEFDCIIRYCKFAGVPVTNTSPDNLYKWLEQSQPQMVFIMGYRHLVDVKNIPPALVMHFYNIHFSSLPAFKGPMPVFWQIKNGVEYLGISIHRIDKKFDTGSLLWTKKIRRVSHLPFGMAHSILASESIEGIIFLISHFIQRKELPIVKYDKKESSYYSRPSLRDVWINWDVMNADEIINLINACNPWNKGAVTLYRDKEVKVIDAEIINTAVNNNLLSPGTIIADKNTLQVLCRKNKVISINMLNLDGNFVPTRHADKFGFCKGKRLGGKLPGI